MPSLFHIDLNLSKDYCLWLEDIFKFATFLTVLHIFSLIGGKTRSTGEFLQNLIVTLIGLTFYHLILKKVLTFVYKCNEKEGFSRTIKLF